MILIEAPGIPVAFARSGGNGRVRFTPKKQRCAMGDLKIMAAAAMKGRKPLEGPLAVLLTFGWLTPKSWSKRRRLSPEAFWKASRPDIDNLAKLVNDALNGIVWADDALIVHQTINKTYAKYAFTRIHVETVSEGHAKHVWEQCLEEGARSSNPPAMVEASA